MNSQNGNNKKAIYSSGQKVLANVAVGIVIVFFSLLFFTNSMSKPIGHDEHMYCTGGYLMAEGKLIYRDFSYLTHLPYHPLLLAFIYKVTGTQYYLLAGRIFSVACEIGIIICIAGICKSILRKFPILAACFAIAAVTMYSTNYFVLFATGYAWNHSAVIFAIWPISVLLRAPEAFFLNIIKMPTLNASYIFEDGLVHDKTRLTTIALTSSAYLGTILTLVYAAFVFIIHRTKIKTYDKSKALLFILVPAAFVLIAFIPPLMWRQYWAVPLAFLVIVPAYPLVYMFHAAAMGKLRYFYIKTALLLIFATAGLSTYETLPVITENFASISKPARWVPFRLHKIAEDIKKEIITHGPVLTLSPLYAIEGESEIYTELSAGPFVYRIADALTEKEKNIIQAVGPNNLKALTEREKPSAIIVGTEPDVLENPILEIIPKSGWREKNYGEQGPVVYFRMDSDKKGKTQQ